MFSSKLKIFCLKKSINTCTVIPAFQIPKTSYSSEPNVVRSKVPDINIPNVFLDEYLWRDLDKWHDKTAVQCAETGRSYLFSEVYQKSRTLANFLHKFPNLKPGDTVAVILPNIPEFPIVLLGAIQAGFKITLVNWVNTPDVHLDILGSVRVVVPCELKQGVEEARIDETTRQFLSSETKLVFTLTELWPKVNQAIKNSNVDIPVVVINHQQNQSTPAGAIKFDEILEGDHELKFKISRNLDDVILLPYSSGTTGVPKGVELTNRNIVSNLSQMSFGGFNLHSNTEGSNQEVLPGVLPWFHIYGLIMVLFNTLSLGCKQITIPKFGSQIFIKMLKEHQPTFMHLVPPIVLFLANNSEVRPEHLSQVRTIVTGAAPLGASDIEKLHKKSNGKVNILQAYGLTEASPLTHTQTTEMANGIKSGSSGLAVPNTDCKIVTVDEETKKGLGPNQSGELLVRGPQVMKGYHKNVDATRDVLDADGWLRTGDIAHYDEDGHFYITDRLKELIKVKGFQVAPAELEQLLRTHPDIEDVAVIGVPHEALGEAPKAFVVPKQGGKFSSAKIHEFVAVKAANYKQLVGGIVIVDSIPRSLAGKILRRQLK